MNNFQINNIKNNNTTEKNVFLACAEGTLREAQVAFRLLQHQSGRGTTESDYAKLERDWETSQDYM